MIPKRTQQDPVTVSIHLEPFQLEGLKELAKRMPYDSEEDLIKVVLSRGLVEMLTAENDEEVSPEELKRNHDAAKAHMKELQSGQPLTSKAVRPFPTPAVLYRRRQEQRQRQTEQDLAQDIGFADPGEAIPVEHRHVERYLAFSITEELRQRVEDFLDAHPDLSEEAALAELLEAGLDRAESETSPEAKKAKAMVSLAERLRARAGRRCE